MNDDHDLPPLPIPAPPETQVAESSRRHSHRSKDKASRRELATLLLLEKNEHRAAQREVARLTELLRLQTLRTEEAESKVVIATERLKSINEERIAAIRETARANESLGLYKFQLETAQNEIDRAQSVFNIVEAERFKAELVGAKSRTMARKLNAQHKVQMAREEGRRQGIQEGLEAGRLSVYTTEGEDDPDVTNYRGSQNFDYDDYYSEALNSPHASDLDEPYSPRTTASAFQNTNFGHATTPVPPSASHSRPRPGPSYSSATPDPVPIPAPSVSTRAPPNGPTTPDPIPVPSPVPPVAPVAAHPSAPLSPNFVPFHDIHPISVHNEAPHPRHDHVDVPPDGFIPSVGPDPGSLPQIPPAHEFLHNVHAIVGEEPVVAHAMSSRAQSTRAESVRRAPSAAGSIRPVQMPTPRMSTNLQGIEHQAHQHSSQSSDFGGGAWPAPAPTAQSNGSSGAIPISVLPPSPESRESIGHVGNPSLGSHLFGPGVAGVASSSQRFVPLNPQPGPSTILGTYFGDTVYSYDPVGLSTQAAFDNLSSGSSTPSTLTTPPNRRRVPLTIVPE